MHLHTPSPLKAEMETNRRIELLETHMREVSPSRVEELIGIFIRATELEISFWDMGLSETKV